MKGSVDAHNENSSLASKTGFQIGVNQGQVNASRLLEAEGRFMEIMRGPLDLASGIERADIVVGIPFYNESETIGTVLRTVRKGLGKYYGDKKCVIVAAGAPAGANALNAIRAVRKGSKIGRIAFLLNDERINGKGWAIRAILTIAQKLGADLAIVEADSTSRIKDDSTEGFAENWISLLLEPVKKMGMDLVISHFNRHRFESPISDHLVYPLLSAIYNRPIHDPLGGQWGISQRLLDTYLQEPRPWNNAISGYGIDIWLTIKAISNKAKICQTNLGIKIHKPSAVKIELVLRQVAEALFELILYDEKWWKKFQLTEDLSLLQPPATFGTSKAVRPDEVPVMPRALIDKYKLGFNKFHSVYERIFSKETYKRLEKLASTETEQFVFPVALWTQAVYQFILAFAFSEKLAKGDLMNSFISLHEGYVGGTAGELQTLKANLKNISPEEAEELVSLKAERQTEELANEFIHQRSRFISAWQKNETAVTSPVSIPTYLEFIPGVPLVVPLEIPQPDGRFITANAIYDSIFHGYEHEFEQFVYERLKTPRDASSREIVESIRGYIHDIENEIGTTLLPGDLSTVQGIQEMAEALFRLFPHEDIIFLSSEMASWILFNNPPLNLLAKLGYSDLKTLIAEHEPNDVLAITAWSEEQEYTAKVLALLRHNLRSEHFIAGSLKPLIVSHEQFPSVVEMAEVPDLNKISGRLVISNLHKGMGGEFPKIFYFTAIAKSIIEAERLSNIWRIFAGGRSDFGEKLVNSLGEHWGRTPLSVHNIFENGNQQLLAKRLNKMAQDIAREAGRDETRLALAKHLKMAAESYHLAMTLADGTFVPCSISTWARYSYEGGTGLPAPLSLHVERDWSSRQFLTEYFKTGGGREEMIEEKIIELMGQGREWVDMASVLLGEVKEEEEVVPEQIITPEPPAGALVRFEGNPILKPIKEHYWESKYTLNASSVNLDGKIFLIYRAAGEDGVSRLGLAVSENGFQISERLDKPIFEPKYRYEAKGCEDPRLTLIEDRVYMLYTAYDGLTAQIAMSSIHINDFLNYRWQTWRRHGLVFPGFTDKDGTLFSERFNGKFAVLHRFEPHIWITFSTHLSCPWSRNENKILAGSRSGMVWDGNKIGAGTQPIKTKFGWLLITHGVDYALVYRLGVMLLDLADPTILLYRSPNYILEPKASYEIGEPGKSWVPNVVFTCGAVARENSKKILDAEDELLVYYGAADSVIGVALARISELIPEMFR